jgi:hypothetical protein
LRILVDPDGVLEAEDLGTVNGLYAEDGKRRQARIALDGERVVRIGRTLLRVRTTDYPVPAERQAVGAMRSGRLILALSLTVIALALLSLWLAETDEPQLSRYLLPVMGMILIVLIWTTGWSVLSRIFSGHALFDRHLVIALSAVLIFFLFDEISDYGAFAFSARWLAEYAYVVSWLLLGALCFAHLREIAPRRPIRRFAVVGGLALAAIAAQTVARSDDVTRYGQQSYLSELKPPEFRVKSPLDENAFFSNTDRIKKQIDKARLEPPTGRGLLDFDVDSEE